MVLKRDLSEIFYLKDDWYKESQEDINGKKLNEYDDDDWFYSNGQQHILCTEAEQLLDYDECNEYIDHWALRGEFDDYAGFDGLVDWSVRQHKDLQISREYIEKMVFQFVSEDMEHYLEWLWEERN